MYFKEVFLSCLKTQSLSKRNFSPQKSLSSQPCSPQSLLSALGLSIPATVEFTLQVFGVFCALEILGGRNGFFAILVYILLGAVGLPVFAHFTGGLSAITGTTGGYIVGFLFIGLVYWAAEAFIGKHIAVRIGGNAHWSCNMLRFRNRLVYVCFYQNQWSRYTHAGPEMVRFPLYTV